MISRKEFGVGFLLALTLTLILNVPTFLRYTHTGKTDGAFLLSIATEDEARYVSRIKEFTDGAKLMGNPFIAEHKGDLPPGGFAELAVAIPMKVLNLSLESAIALTDLLFPILIISLTYLWCFGALKNRWLAIAATLLIIGELRIGLLRDPHPKVTLLPASLYLFALFGLQEKNWTLLLRGVLLGVMFHTYPYHWTLFVLFEALLTCTRFLEGKSLNQTFKRCLLLFGPFALFAIPWILLVRNSVDPRVIQAAYEHLGLVHTRLPVAPSLQIQLIIWIAALAILGKTKIARTRPVEKVCVMLIAGFILVNSNIITNTEAEFLGHYGRVLWPFVVVAALLAGQAVARPPLLKKVAVTLSLVGLICICESAYRGIDVIDQTEVRFSKYDNVIKYFNESSPKGSVVLASRDLSQLLTVKTSDYAFFHYGARFLFVPEDELTNRFLAFASVFPEDIDQGDGKYIAVFGNNYGSSYSKARTVYIIKKTLGLEKDPFTKTQADFIKDQSLRMKIDRELTKTNWNDVKKSLETHRVDYAVTEKALPRELQSLFTKIATVDGMEIWKKR